MSMKKIFNKRNVILLLTIILIIIISFISGQFLIGKLITTNTKETSNIEDNILNNEESTLNIEKNNTISEFFPNDITEITLVNYLSDLTNPTTYTINDIENMKEFIELFTNSTWKEDKSDYSNSTTFCKITIKGSTNTTFNMLGIGGIKSNYGIVQVINDDYNKVYQISKATYLEILAFTNEKYYLHDSDLEIPNQDKCYEAQKEAFLGLDETTINEIQKEIRQIHSGLEFTLLDAIHILKDSNSPYWVRFTESETYEEPLDSSTTVERNGILTIYLNRTNEVLSKIKNNTVKSDLEVAYTYLKEGINNHDISKLFEAHKIIHDYDYWVINTPVHLDYEPADWSGIDTYFGVTSILK